MSRPFYVTTPIYYVNDVPHIGHAYTTIAADVLARYHRMLGDDVFFLTGTDEHGQKIQEAAEAKGETPKALADRVVVRFQEAWKNLNISNTAFIRTTDPHHIEAVKKIWKIVADRGDIKLDIYEDWYCTPCETFLTETQLQNGKCPQCGRDVKKIKEESYFFKLSAYQKQVLAYCTDDHVLPKTKANEVKSFVNQGLRDLSISRTSFNWGIPVPGDPKHVMYVWFDALFNYVTALGYGNGDNALYEKFWPADVHIVGKDILRFHTVYWPAFLDSAGMQKPKSVFAHGWWTIEGKKMSKSLGNVVDPNEMVERYGADAFRYFLMREVPFGEDGDFSIKALEQRINSDLANDLGNLLSRSISMHLKYFGDKSVPSFGQNAEAALNVDTRASLMKLFDADAHTVLAKFYGNCQFHNVLQHVWQALGMANGYIDRAAPWKLVKESDEDSKEKLKTVMNTLLETLRLASLAICPFMPTKANQIWKALGLPGTVEDHIPFEKFFVWQDFPEGLTLTQPEHLFPRIDLKK